MYNLFFQEAVVSIEIIEGQLLVKDQIREYMDQGSQLEHWSYLDYFLGTYDGKSSKKPLPFMVTHPAFRSPIVMTVTRPVTAEYSMHLVMKPCPFFLVIGFQKKIRQISMASLKLLL